MFFNQRPNVVQELSYTTGACHVFQPSTYSTISFVTIKTDFVNHDSTRDSQTDISTEATMITGSSPSFGFVCSQTDISTEAKAKAG
jgi:hypothetical protein